jgi:hypothetical protein
MSRIEMSSIEMSSIEMSKIEMSSIEMSKIEMSSIEMSKIEMGSMAFYSSDPTEPIDPPRVNTTHDGRYVDDVLDDYTTSANYIVDDVGKLYRRRRWQIIS